MAEMSPGAALRELEHAQAGLKKARELLKHARDGSIAFHRVWDAGWSSLRAAHRVMAAIPGEAIDDAVMTRQLALERYAAALLVRLRRLKRREDTGSTSGAGDVDDHDDDDGED